MARFDSVRRLVDDAIAAHAFPGIVLLVGHKGREVFSMAAGHRQVEPELGEPMSEDTLFDLASLTKPLATAILTLRHFYAHGLSLDSEIGQFIPEVPPDTGALTVRSLLLHVSGLPPVPDIFKSFTEPRQDPEGAREHLYSLRPIAPAGEQVIYSCTGYFFLGEILRRRTGKRLSSLYGEQVTTPLAIDELGYNPGAARRELCAATEYCGFRGRRLRGEVHDENAWCSGGDAGNAGLFGTARAIYRVSRVFTDGGVVDGYRVLPEEAVALMTASFTDGLNERRSHGLMMAGPDSPAGPSASPGSFGHTGFTGTSIWIDPDRELVVVALTNRVHFGRDQTQEAIATFRRELHGEIFRLIDAA